MDDSCLEVDSTTGDMRVVKEDGPNPHTFVASIVATSTTKYYAQFDSVKGRLDPICAPCKVKNYTKNELNKHIYLTYLNFFVCLTIDYAPELSNEF